MFNVAVDTTQSLPIPGYKGPVVSPLAGQPAAVTPLRFVYSLRLPLRASLRLLLRYASFTRCACPCGPACGCYSATLRLPENKISQVQPRE